ncbi:hypothetical protein KY347_07115 [Candidatus Woesearchaeota archaeon]|nr:hypothetical protein [Candidatus Woesearchaeota archaeon]
MRIQHVFGKLKAEKNINEDLGFMLTNKNGSYAFLRQNPSSRYEGVFLFDCGNMYKTIESINVSGGGEIRKIINGFYFVQRERKNITEKFLMPRNYSSLVYELSKEAWIELFLDCKDSYDNAEFGRHYDIFEEKNCIVVKFTKRAEENEGGIEGVEQYALYLAVRTESLDYKKISRWIERHYSSDENRGSKPYFRHVLHALDIKGKIFVFSLGKERNKAIEEANYIFKSLDAIKKNEETMFYGLFSNNEKISRAIKTKKMDSKTKLAYISALNSLHSLTVSSEKPGILAGLPWFFQFWSRDEAVSLKALRYADTELAKRILAGRIGKIQDDGRLPNIYHSGSSPTNADAAGWLFNRAPGFYDGLKANIEALEQLKKRISHIKGRKIRHKKIIMLVNKVERALKNKEKENKYLLNKKLDSIKKCAERLTESCSKYGLIYNKSGETWMDTQFRGNGREGFSIEIQALALAMYKYAFMVTGDKEYKILEDKLKRNVIDRFFDNSMLADNLKDNVIRPNVFIACYAYPELLPKKEWEKCFEKALEALWLDFGGLSTIDKKSPDFVPAHTGEFPKSYHCGDSWFWINNLAGMILFKVNKKKFRTKIRKILNASVEEILWKGIIGAHSELSSAENLRSEGCLNQAWSSAMFAEFSDALCFSSKT